MSDTTPQSPWASLQKPGHIDFLLFLQEQAALLTAHTEGAVIASLEMGDPNHGEWLFFLQSFSLRDRRTLFTILTANDQKIGIRPANTRDTSFYDSSEAAKQGFRNMAAGVASLLSPVWITGAMILAREKAEKEAEKAKEAKPTP